MGNERQIVLEVVGQLAAQLSPDYPAASWTSELEVDLGIGSLERLELIQRLEQRLGRPIDEQQAFRARQVSDLLASAATRKADSHIDVSGRQLPPAPRQARSWIEALLYQAEHQPDEVALVLLEGDTEAAAPSYSELVAQARRVGAGLLALGVRPGDRVALMLPTCLDFFLAFYGILWIGAVTVPLYPPLRLDQADDFIARQDGILENCGARVLISLPQLAPMAQLLRRRSGLQTITSVKALSHSGVAALGPPGQLALIQYTSGSTGRPKGVALSHENLLANTWAFGKEFGMVSGEVMVSWLPLYHDMGLIGTTLGSLSHGLGLVVMGPEQFLARPVHWLQAITRYRGSLSAAPNFAYGLCAERIPEGDLSRLELSCWRNALNGAEPILPETVDAFVRRFEPYGFRASALYPAYGLAEATLAVTLNPPGRGLRRESIDLERLPSVCPGTHEVISCGRPIEDVELRIVSEHGECLPERIQGCIQVRGRSVMHGYFGEPPRAGAWLDTGDLGFLWDGELFVSGRRKDLIIVGGRNLHPNDIEASLAKVSGIRKGCVAAFGTEQGGSQRLVVLAETRKPGPELRRQAVQMIQRETGLLAELVLLPPRTLPKTPSGKIRRSESRRRYLQGQLQPPRLSWKWVASAAWAWADSLRPRLRELWVAACTLVCWLELTLGGRPVQSCVRRLLSRLGIDWEVVGQASGPGPLCLVSNHASLLDPLLLIAAWTGPPLKFVVSEGAAQHPLLRGLCRGHLVVRRGQGQAALALAQIQQSLAAGDCLVVFPEGGIEATPGVRGFATGAFQACAATGTPVQPVAIGGTRRLLPLSAWAPVPGGVKVHFAPPLQSRGESFLEVAQLAQSARRSVAEMLGEAFVESRLARQD